VATEAQGSAHEIRIAADRIRHQAVADYLSAYTTGVCVQSEAKASPLLCTYLQVLQDKIRKGGPRGNAEGQPRDQPRNALSVHLTPYVLIRGRKHPLRIPWAILSARKITNFSGIPAEKLTQPV
jgi:hypothetical protein